MSPLAPSTVAPATWPETLRQVRLKTWIQCFAWTSLIAISVVTVLICFVSEDWWVSRLLTYLPRQPYLIPAVVLLPLTLWKAPRQAWTQILALILVLGPIMGPTAPLEAETALAPGRHLLRIASGNLQEGKGSLRKLLGEIRPFKPDLVVFQESSRGCELLLDEFSDWEVAHLGSYFVGSRYPLRVVDHCRAKAFDRWTGISVEIDTPDGTILVSNIHLMTPRHGANDLTLSSPLTGAGVEEFDWHQRLREDEAAETQSYLSSLPDHPQLVIGDFNAPSTSSLYRAHWSQLKNAFDTAGWGYGYTSPCNASRKWLTNTPWMRIDHVLTDERWTIHHCSIGQTDGSDHRMLFTEVSLK